MKGKFTFLKMGLVGLFFTFGAVASAQDIANPGDFSPPLNPADVSAIFCTGENVVLQASLEDENGVAFDSWVWHVPDGSGGHMVSANTTRDLVLTPTELESGYNIIRVYGKMGTDQCLSDDYDEVTIYVLPSLNVTVSTNTADLIYCETDIPGTGDEIILTASVTENPDAPESFDLQYQWWKILASDGSGTKINIGGNTQSYTLIAGVDDEVGEWIYGVDVTYSVKDACGPYSSFDGTNGGIDVVVTPTPSAPTITIVSTP